MFFNCIINNHFCPNLHNSVIKKIEHINVFRNNLQAKGAPSLPLPDPPQGSSVFAPARPSPGELRLCPCQTLPRGAPSLPLPDPPQGSSVFAPARPSPGELRLCPCQTLPRGAPSLPLPDPPQGSSVFAPARPSPGELRLCPCQTGFIVLFKRMSMKNS